MMENSQANLKRKTKIKFPLVKPLSHDLFDRDAIKVYQRLRRFDHEAYFVGGCIRDLLLGSTPKDFDLVTSAPPKQVRGIFRNSRIIGKRFLLVNVLFGRKTIEVATFRKTPWQDGIPQNQQNMLIQHDNFFGSDLEDARRRDFTINALLYCPDEREVVDYVDGLRDLQEGKIRTIGDPFIKMAEDPIRIIRALKFAAKLNFDIVPSVARAIDECSSQLALSPRPRVLLEILKILRGGEVLPCFEQMAKSPALEVILPDLAKLWPHESSYMLSFKEHLSALDYIGAEERAFFSDASLLTILSLPLLDSKAKEGKVPLTSDYFEKNLKGMAESLNLSKRMLEKIRNIIAIQPRLEKKSKSCIRYLAHYPEAMEFLKIRTLGGLAPRDSLHFWENYLEHNPSKKKRKRSRRPPQV